MFLVTRNGHIARRERLARRLLNRVACTHDSQPKSFHVVAFLRIDTLHIVEILVRALIDFFWSSLNGLTCDSEESSLRPFDLRWRIRPFWIRLGCGSVDEIIVELSGSVFAALKSFATPFRPMTVCT